MSDTEPVALPRPPKSDMDCWPFDCRAYHDTWAHKEGEDPCRCACHATNGRGPTLSRPALRAVR